MDKFKLLVNLKSLVKSALEICRFKHQFTQKQPSTGVIIKSIPKICSQFTGEHTRGSVISINLLCTVTPCHGCSFLNLLHIFRSHFIRTAKDGFLTHENETGLGNTENVTLHKNIIFR